MTALKPLPPLLTVREVAKYLRVTPSAIWMRIQRGRLPYVRVGGRLYVREDTLKGLVSEHGARAPRRRRGGR